MLNSHAQRSLLRKFLVPIEETFFKCRLLAKCRPWPALNSPSLDDQSWPSKSMRSTRPFERPGTSHCRVWILARLLADLPEFLNHPLVIEGIDGVDIKIHQVHVGLQEGCQFLGVVCLDEQESGSATCQVVPSLDVFRIIGSCLMLLDNPLGHLLAGGVRMPLETAIL